MYCIKQYAYKNIWSTYSFFLTAYIQNLYLSHNFWNLTLKHQKHTLNLQSHTLINSKIKPECILRKRCLQMFAFWHVLLIFWMQCFILQEMWGILHFVCAILGFVCKVWEKKRQSFENVCKLLNFLDINVHFPQQQYVICILSTDIIIP